MYLCKKVGFSRKQPIHIVLGINLDFFWIGHEILDFLRPSDSHWRFPFQIPPQRTNAPSPFDFLRKTNRFWADLPLVCNFLFIKNCLYVYEKLQRKPTGRGLKNFTFRPYKFENSGFLTTTHRGARGKSLSAWLC